MALNLIGVYYERFYFINFTEDIINVTLYLANETTADVITATVYDQDNELLEGSYIKATRYDIDSNTYRLVEMALTNFEGEGTLHLVQNSEYYKFMLYYPFDTLKQTSSETYIRSTSILFQIDTIDPIATDFDRTMDIDHALSFNNLTNKFTWTYSDSNNIITQACLRTYRLSILGNNSLYSSYLPTTAGTIQLNVDGLNGSTYCANTYVSLSGTERYIDGLCYTYPSKDSNPAQQMGLLIAFIMTIAFAFAFKYGVELGIIALPMPLLFCVLMGIVNLSLTTVIGIEFGAIILAIILNKVID